MSKQFRSEDFKQQILKECQEVGNVALVARRHDIATSTIHGWRRKAAQRGLIKALPREMQARLKEVESRLRDTATENDKLKRIVAEKELELAILREMRDTLNPQ